MKVEEGEKEGAKARGEYLKWVQEHETLKVCSMAVRPALMSMH